MLDPKPPLYYFEAKFLKALTDKFVQEFLKKRGLEVPLYLQTLQDMAKCRPDDPHEYKRSKKGYVLTRPSWIVFIPNGMASPVSFVKGSFDTIASNFKKDSEIGSCFASWMRMNKFSLYQMEVGDSGTRKKIVT